MIAGVLSNLEVQGGRILFNILNEMHLAGCIRLDFLQG